MLTGMARNLEPGREAPTVITPRDALRLFRQIFEDPQEEERSQTDVTHDDPIVTGKIALAQMKEFPDYYERLERMEREAELDWASRGAAT
jgi:hypothetical protein